MRRNTNRSAPAAGTRRPAARPFHRSEFTPEEARMFAPRQLLVAVMLLALGVTATTVA